ncbi:MAG: hypothetical protein ACYDA2_00755 [Acidimicrobiales bacterium]
MLGLVVVLLGALFVSMGLHAIAAGDRPAKPRSPVAGSGFDERPPSRTTRRVAGAMWIVLGTLFLVAAFTHQVP